MAAQGHKTPNAWAAEPLLAVMWEEYQACRCVQFVTFTVPKGKTEERRVTTLFPTHIATWPYPGGLRNQPYLVVKIFIAFLQGEQQGSLRAMR